MAERICPVFIGYLLLSPFRKISQNPYKILNRFLKPGMNVLDFGSAMGFFSIPIAHMVNPDGKVICVDIQEKMLTVLQKRAKRAGVSNLIETHICTNDSVKLERYHGKIDFILAFAVAHEVPDQNFMFSELYKVLKPKGKLLFAEPSGHISKIDFKNSVSIALKNNFVEVELLNIRRSYSILFGKS